MDFRRKKTDIHLLLIGGTCVERVSDFCFLGVNFMEDLTWSVHAAYCPLPSLAGTGLQYINLINLERRASDVLYTILVNCP